MPTISQVSTPERGTRIIIPVFTDETPVVLTFSQLITPTWSLTTRNGRIINSREDEVLTVLYVVLTDEDLVMVDNDPWRVVTFEAFYNSATYGNGLRVNDQYEFPITPLVKVF